MALFTYHSIVAASGKELFAWHERPEALSDLLPPGGFVRVLARAGGVDDGGVVTLGIGVGPLRVRWVARHFGYVRGEQFCDEQVSGPFRRWRHTHRVQPLDTDRAMLIDRIEYELPVPQWVQRLLDPAVRFGLTRMFAERHRVTADGLARQRGLQGLA